jgi:hypothetical protein
MRNRRFLVAALVCFAIAALCLTGMTQDKPLTFKALQVGYGAAVLVNSWQTLYALRYGPTGIGYAKGSTFLNEMIAHPVKGLMFETAVTVGVILITNTLWKTSKPAAWIVTALAVAVQAYAVIHNFADIRRANR